ncbi:hypothetical protein SAMN04487820_101112 [Actinopolyspora mzabensis]|uniref:Uncharacterized protein n=1 Tax=Actinopolyspora mzabensis TaxID=995066 RepID=A0A1G8VIR0_ACTMZ|nr:hypothetical protein SAMN04487820_101112 [Actinopolyspora mzabensis]
MGSELCRASSCESGRKGPRRTDQGFLCRGCRERLASNLRILPTLYSDCNRGGGSKEVRVIRKRPRRAANIDSSINATTAEIRSSILTVLASWAGLVTEERRLTPPVREISALACFLAHHVDWLARHSAAGDLVDEIRYLERTARGIAYPDDGRRVRVGYCPDSDCAGELFALIRPHGEIPPSEIVCTTSPTHSWPVTWWSKLARQIRSSEGE